MGAEFVYCRIVRGGGIDSLNANQVLVVSNQEVREIMHGKDSEMVSLIQRAYEIQHDGNASLPHSSFLRFPHQPKNRIIALPSYIGEEWNVAGIKWISSFPQNIIENKSRASAAIILNDMADGRPKAFLEGSLISSKRTAASALLATQSLMEGPVEQMGFVGCGLINSEIADMHLRSNPLLNRLYLFDTDMKRAQGLKNLLLSKHPDIQIKLMPEWLELMQSVQLVSLATTALSPYIDEIPAHSVVLHISLRDIQPEVILNSVNIVDDVDHVCRENTSLHLAELKSGNRGFIDGTIVDLKRGLKPQRGKSIVFSPFGLGVLDLILAEFIYHTAIKTGRGRWVDFFENIAIELEVGS